jgi:hypothetical protein
VEVVVTFHQWGLRSCDYGEEECGRRDCSGNIGFAEETVSKDGIEDSELRMSDDDGAGGEILLTCHASGTFLRFARTKSAATIRDVLPGPVKVFRRASRILSREPVTLRTSATVNAIDFSGRRAPEAMAKGVTGKERGKEGVKCVKEKNKQQSKKVR